MMNIMAAQSVNVVTVNMLLSVVFVSGTLDGCPEKSALFITAPTEMEALSGSCLQIPCQFRHKEEHKFSNTSQTFGVWIKQASHFKNKPHNVIFNSSLSVNKYPMTLTGNLRERNCTTLFSNLTTSYTDRYYFRVENEASKATADCDPLQITVTDSPWSPTINISGDLKEKESVTITCSAVTPCPHSPPQLTWSLQQDSHSKTEENTDGTFTTKIQETITLSDTHDGDTISCSVTYPVDGGTYKTAEAQETLSVSYAPKNTSASISPSGLVSAGMWVNLTCSSRAKPPVSSFTWFKNSKHGAMKVSEGEFYSFSATDGGVYYCVATNHLGNQTSQEISLTLEAVSQNNIAYISLGGITVIIVLIGLLAGVWRFKNHQTQREAQNQPGEELAPQIAANKTEQDLHYEEISFSKRRREPPSVCVQSSEEEQETLYSQVRVARPQSRTEDLYAQVKKN